VGSCPIPGTCGTGRCWSWLPPWPATPLGLGQNLSLAAASGLLALATVKLVEDPVRFSSWLRARPRRSLALGAGLTVGAAAATMATAVLVPIPHGQGLAAPPAVIRITRPPRARHTSTEDPAAARLASLSAPVVRAVAKAVTVGTVPANLEPSLESAHANQPRPVADGCLIRWLGVGSGRCVYGSPGATAGGPTCCSASGPNGLPWSCWGRPATTATSTTSRCTGRRGSPGWPSWRAQTLACPDGTSAL
jgi:hypothetical protein